MSNELDTPAPRFERDGHIYELRDGKIIRDGKYVAVLLSPGYGAGFTTLAYGNTITPFQPEIVAAVLAGRRDMITTESMESAGFGNIYDGGVSDLEIEWLPAGTVFRITEYDGSESITIINDNATWRA